MPSSGRTNLRARRAALQAAAAQQSFGLEDELSFGSDEDLMETIGEIEVPETSSSTPELLPSDSIQMMSNGAIQGGGSLRLKNKKSTSSSSSKNKDPRLRKEHNSSSSSLASSTHLLPPLPPVPSGSTLDLPADMFGDMSPGSSHKRGSLMGAFKVKGLRKWRDDSSSRAASYITDSASAASTLSLAKIASNSSRPSFASSTAYPTSTASNAVPHLGPLSLPSIDSTSESGKQSGTDSFEIKSIAVVSANSVHNSPAQASISTFSSPKPAQSPWASNVNGITSAILPAFPAAVASLEPITVFSALAAKRPPSSILSSGAERGPNGFRQPWTSARWTPCTLVFTSFKVSVAPDETAGGDAERTIAHIHVFSSKQPVSTGSISSSMGIRRSKSNAGINPEPVGPRVEVERRTLSRESTATVCENCTDGDGRSVVLRILFGDEDRTKAGNEWLLEMKDESQLYEWIRQIKKTAIMINAEELGYGHAVRSAYENTNVSADELAHKLSLHARAVAEGRERQAKKAAGAGAAANKVAPPAPGSAGSQDEQRHASLELAQGAALARSRSAETNELRNGAAAVPRHPSFELTPTATVASGLQKQQTTATANRTVNGNGSTGTSNGRLLFDDEPLGSDTGLTLSGLTLDSGFSFPAPPSALPTLPPVKRVPAPPPRSDSVVPVAPIMTTSTTSSNVASLDSPAASSVSTLGKSPQFVPSDNLPSTSTVNSADSEDDEPSFVRPPTPPRGGKSNGVSCPPVTQSAMLGANRAVAASSAVAASIASTNGSSGTSTTSRLRRLRGKPQVVDIMAEFSAVEAEHLPPAEDEEPIREDRERRIRFAGVEE